MSAPFFSRDESSGMINVTEALRTAWVGWTMMDGERETHKILRGLLQTGSITVLRGQIQT